MGPVTNFRTWRNPVDRGWGTMRRDGTRWTFVPQLDQMTDVPGLVGHVHQAVAPLVDHLLRWLETRRGRALDKTGNWALSVRPIRGREAEAYAGVIDAWSNHSWGGAFDVEAPRNALGAYGRGDFPPGWEDECHRWGFAWGAAVRDGGDYVDRPDRMHAEFIGDTAQAAEYVEQLTGAQLGVPHRGDEPVAPIPIAVSSDGTFRELVAVEAGSSSGVVDRAWIAFGTAWGATHFDVCFLGADGRVMGPKAEKHVDLANNRRDFLEAPSGAVLATIEGKAAVGARPAAALVCKGKAL